MSATREILLLDSLFDDISVEVATAAGRGWSLRRWSGDARDLADAAVVVHVRTKVNRDLMANTPRLRVVGRFGTGLDSVDLLAAGERGIRVVGVRDYCIPELSAHTLGLAFALERRIDAVRDGRLKVDDTWQQVASRLPIVGRTEVAVIGLGSIGSAVARALFAIGMTVLAVSQRADAASSMGIRLVSLETALQGSGLVFLHAALGEGTRGYIDAERYAQMRPGTLLINTARIGLLDEAATAAALASGRLAGLALDASLAPTSPLRAFLDDPRLLVTPHIGWYSERSATELRVRTIADTIAAAEAASDKH